MEWIIVILLSALVTGLPGPRRELSNFIEGCIRAIVVCFAALMLLAGAVGYAFKRAFLPGLWTLAAIGAVLVASSFYRFYSVTITPPDEIISLSLKAHEANVSAMVEYQRASSKLRKLEERERRLNEINSENRAALRQNAIENAFNKKLAAALQGRQETFPTSLTKISNNAPESSELTALRNYVEKFGNMRLQTPSNQSHLNSSSIEELQTASSLPPAISYARAIFKEEWDRKSEPLGVIPAYCILLSLPLFTLLAGRLFRYLVTALTSSSSHSDLPELQESN